MKKLNFLKFSLRSKMVITLSMVVVAVSCIILYLSTRMIIEDKRAYIYDNAYQSLDNGHASLELFFENKLNFVNVFNTFLQDPSLLDKKQLASDRDLYQTLSLDLNLPKNEQVIERLYTNLEYSSLYRKREQFLELSNEYLISITEEVKSKEILEKLHYVKGRAPRLLIFVYGKTANKIYCFDFLLDKLYNNIFNKQSFETILVNSQGEFLFHNRPYETDERQQSFFRKFINDKKKPAASRKAVSSGVVEEIVGETEYILGFKQLSRFPDHFIFSGVKTSEAYEVTSILIINAVVYTLFLIGAFNILSIFIARSITNPLNKLTQVIKTISEGKYNVRVVPQSTTELQLVADAFNEMVVKIQDYQNKLLEYNRTLEQKVEERTVSLKNANDFIKTMVDSLGQGLLVFGREGICLDLHTKACIDLIGENPADKKLADLIKAEDKNLLTDWIENLFEEMIPFESLVELGQKSIPCKEDYRSFNFKHVTLEFFPIRNDEGRVKNVVMVASDKTREFKAFKEVEAQQNYVKLVTKVLNDKIRFIRFADLFEESLKREKEIVANKGLINKDDFMRLLHSMKGSAAFYSLQEVVTALHDFETFMLQDSLTSEDIVLKIDGVLQKMNSSISKLRGLIGDTTRRVVEVDEIKLRKFWKFLMARNKQVAQLFSSNFLDKEVKHYVGQYKELVVDLAAKLGKKIKPLEVQNGDIRVDMNHFQEFFDSCIHIFRNAVDHAIEAPEIRVSSGKPEEGSIRVSFGIVKSSTASYLEFNVHDDGGGIDPGRIRSKMIQLGYPQDVIDKSDSDIVYHIFDANFSTAETVSDISGRGVGLYDIKMNLDKLRGTIELETRIGKGTLFSFLLPLPDSA